jgi:hypothetical protein
MPRHVVRNASVASLRWMLAAYSRSGDNYWRKKEIGEEEGFNWSSTSVFPYPLQTAWVSFNTPFPYTVHSGPEYRVFGLLALRPTRHRGETGSVLVAVSRPSNGALLTVDSWWEYCGMAHPRPIQFDAGVSRTAALEDGRG